jgi:hypothetical protein
MSVANRSEILSGLKSLFLCMLMNRVDRIMLAIMLHQATDREVSELAIPHARHNFQMQKTGIMAASHA